MVMTAPSSDGDRSTHSISPRDDGLAPWQSFSLSYQRRLVPASAKYLRQGESGADERAWRARGCCGVRARCAHRFFQFLCFSPRLTSQPYSAPADRGDGSLLRFDGLSGVWRRPKKFILGSRLVLAGY